MSRPKSTRKPRTAINFSIPASEELETLMKGFKPRFGNDDDIRIIKEYGEIKKILSLMESDKDRIKEIRAMTSTQDKRKKEIASREKQLIWLLKRND